jgi:protein gp37
MIFVNSMSDLFYNEIQKEFIARVFDTMERAHWHTFQVLMKRSSLMRDFLRRRYGPMRGPAHMWFGVSVEDGSKKSRIRHLQAAPAGVRMVPGVADCSFSAQPIKRVWRPVSGPCGNAQTSCVDRSVEFDPLRS